MTDSSEQERWRLHGGEISRWDIDRETQAPWLPNTAELLDYLNDLESRVATLRALASEYEGELLRRGEGWADARADAERLRAKAALVDEAVGHFRYLHYPHAPYPRHRISEYDWLARYDALSEKDAQHKENHDGSN